MITVEIDVKGVRSVIDLPENWEEVPDKQLFYYLELLCRPGNERQKAVRLLRRLGLKRRGVNRIPQVYLNHITMHLKWLNDPWKDGRNFMPWIGPFKGPKYKMAGFTLAQLIYAGIFADNLSHLINNNKSKKEVFAQLRLICASLYLPFGLSWNFPFGITPLMENSLKLRAFLFRFIPTWKLQAVFIAFKAQREYLKERFPLAHRGGDGGGSDLGPYGMITSLAGPKFGTVNGVRKNEALLVLTHLEQLAEQNEKLRSS